MDDKAIIEARKRAEKAVEGMTDPALKVKAFEQVFGKLLSSVDAGDSRADEHQPRPRRAGRVTTLPKESDSLPGRLLRLREDGFFAEQRSLSEIREELGSRGWHYPLTTLSGAMQKCVRSRELRRERGKVGNKKIWKYANT
jgi:hypothetical protein